MNKMFIMCSPSCHSNSLWLFTLYKAEILLFKIGTSTCHWHQTQFWVKYGQTQTLG